MSIKFGKFVLKPKPKNKTKNDKSNKAKINFAKNKTRRMELCLAEMRCALYISC